MSAPVITFTDSTSATLATLAFGNVDAGSTSSPISILIWNNKGGGSSVSNATSVTLTTKTFNGLDTGDTVPNGQQVVTNLAVAEECTSIGQGSYTNIGGETTAAIGSAAGTSGTILGTSGGDAAFVNLTITAASNITAGPVQFLLRVNYLYT